MEESRQMGAPVPPQRPQGTKRQPQQQGSAARPGQQSGQQSSQQAGGQAGGGQMQGTQFTDWASI